MTTNSRPTVYIVNKASHDYSAARRFGDVKFITEGEISKFDTASMMRQIEEAFADAQPEDFIILNSFSLLCALVTAAFASRFNKVNLLVFRNSDYVVRGHAFNN